MAPRIRNRPVVVPRCVVCDKRERVCVCVLCGVGVVRLCCAGVSSSVPLCVSCYCSVPNPCCRATHIAKAPSFKERMHAHERALEAVAAAIDGLLQLPEVQHL